MAAYIGLDGKEVEAVQLTEPAFGNGFSAKPGEWRLQMPDGKAYYCENGVFAAQYRQKYPRSSTEACDVVLMAGGVA